jgi:uncharacterized protein YjbI with pentapeptide repeats
MEGDVKKPVLMLIPALIASVSLFFGAAFAFNAADLQKLKATGSCVDCDLSGAVLIHWNLSGADLSGVNLAGANLTDAYLVGANLSGANLSSAILTGASLAHADLSRAKLSAANLLFVNLSGATWTDRSRCGSDSSGSCKK